ncbi:MAG: MYXO-CTERM sorting domain-containing protein [Pseudomonadota bacterium]
MAHRAIVLVAGLTVSMLGFAASPRQPARVEFTPAGTEWIASHSPRAMSSHEPALRQKVAFDTETWMVRRAAPMGLFRQIWGRGVEVDPRAMRDPAVAERAVRRFWEENASMLPAGVTPSDLTPWSNVLTHGTRLVSHHQLVGGVPVLGASVYVAIKNSRLVMVGVRAFPASPLDTRPGIDPARARQVAELALQQRGLDLHASQPELAVFPLLERGNTRLALVYTTELKASGLGRWTAYVDAHKGALLALRDERLFVSGHVDLEHHQRHPGTGFINSPASNMNLTVGTTSGTTDGGGAFDLGATGSTATLGLRGPHVRVLNFSGSALSAQFDNVQDGQTLLWQSDQGEFNLAQLDAFAFTSEVRDFVRSRVDDNGWLDETLKVNVNIADSELVACNAWFDGELSFLTAGSVSGWDCNNTAMVGDIVYHEYGHGLHYASVTGGVGGMDSAVSEGFADFNGATITGDHLLAPYMVVGGEPLRDLEPDKVWPADESFDEHETGLIVGGALWDLRTQMMQRLGEQAGADATRDLFYAVMRVTTDVPSLYEAALLVDDDNGNLDDGTPNVCAIDQAFSQHGLSSARLGLLRIAHEQRTQAAAGQPIPFEAQVAVGNADCSDAQIGTVRLVYSTDGGSALQYADMHSQGSGQYRVELPAMSQGTQIRYRIEARDLTSGTQVAQPNNRSEPWYFVYVGELQPVFCDNLDGEDLGWTHELLAGTMVEGADDWQRATPTGLGGDPDRAFSGDMVWGNDLALQDSWNGQYQSSKKTALSSPAIDLTGKPRARLQFRRWLQVEDGVYDHARVMVNDREVWSNAAADGQTHHLDNEWILFDVDISEVAGGRPDVRVRWELESDQGLEFGGWNIDDVCVYEMVEGSVTPTVDPHNPDPVTAPGDDGSGNHTAVDGCSCQGSSPAGLLPLLALGLLLFRRRSFRKLAYRQAARRPSRALASRDIPSRASAHPTPCDR